MNGSRQEFASLVTALLERGLDLQQQRRLLNLLQVDAVLRAEFVQQMRMDALLRFALAPVAAPSKPSTLRQPALLFALAASLALLLGATVALRRSTPAHAQQGPTFASTKSAIAQMPFSPPATIPTWMSPTASLLEIKNSPP